MRGEWLDNKSALYMLMAKHCEVLGKFQGFFSVGPSCPITMQLFQNLTMKIFGQGLACGQKVKVSFDLENSKAKVKPIGHIWGLEFNRYVCFSFRGNAIGPFLAEI